MRSNVLHGLSVGSAVVVLTAIVYFGRAPRPSAQPSLPQPSAQPSLPQTAQRDPIDELEQLVIERTNRSRIRLNTAPLERDAVLSTAARNHSEDMLRRNFFDHTNPDRQTPADRVERLSGLAVRAIGENIWMWSGTTVPPLSALADQAVADWMASAAHRANMLRPRYTRVGIGAAVTASNVRVTAVFRE